nr:hypothetical protein [Paenibacillus periandrae]
MGTGRARKLAKRRLRLCKGELRLSIEIGYHISYCLAKQQRVVLPYDDVWLSTNLTICGGVTIGDRGVIGAGSVIPYVINHGNYKIIK